MRWSTVYIAGKNCFEKEVVDQLTKNDFLFMEGSRDERGLFLVWIKEGTPVRDLKKAIGAKLVLKYRLQFFESLEAFDQLNLKVLKFTPSEEAMIKRMEDWEESLYSRHSA